MENYPKNNENEVVETQYSKVFYRLVNQLENLKNKAEDPNLPEEERKKAQADFEKWNTELEEEFNKLDMMDKEERAQRIGSQSLSASELPAEQIEQKPAGRVYQDSQLFVHSTPEDSRANELDNDWRRKTA